MLGVEDIVQLDRESAQRRAHDRHVLGQELVLPTELTRRADGDSRLHVGDLVGCGVERQQVGRLAVDERQAGESHVRSTVVVDPGARPGECSELIDREISLIHQLVGRCVDARLTDRVVERRDLPDEQVDLVDVVADGVAGRISHRVELGRDLPNTSGEGVESM